MSAIQPKMSSIVGWHIFGWMVDVRGDGVAFVGWVEGQEMKITLVARPHPSTTMSIQQATQATAGNGHGRDLETG